MFVCAGDIGQLKSHITFLLILCYNIILKLQCLIFRITWGQFLAQFVYCLLRKNIRIFSRMLHYVY